MPRYTKKPFTLAHKKKYKKRSYKKKSFYRFPRTIGFPLSKVVKMKYNTSIRLSPALGATANHYFSCNSIFDPDRTGVGHQPYTHDTWATIYQHYKVIKASIKVVGTVTTNTPAIIGVRLNDDITGGVGFDEVLESGKSNYRVLGDTSTVGRLSRGFNSYKHFPGAGKQDIQAQFGSNPSEEAFFQLFGRHLNSTATGSNIDCVVTITYTVKMWELQDLGIS